PKIPSESQYLAACKAWKESNVSPTLKKNRAQEQCGFIMPLLALMGEPKPFPSLTRAGLEDLLSDYLHQFPALINDLVVDTYGFNGEDVDLVILAGGHSQWYFANEMLEGINTASGTVNLPKIQQESWRVIRLPRPHETVSLGLVYQPMNVEPMKSIVPQQSAPGDRKFTSFEEALELAEQGDAEAQFYVGGCYYNGEGVDKDYGEAVKWYRMAGEKGNAMAQCDVGMCYHFGDGVGIDLTEAVKWYRKAAEQGFSDGQYFLGVCYADGYGISKDDGKAALWFRKASEQGNEYAQKRLDAMEQSDEDYSQPASQSDASATDEYAGYSVFSVGTGLSIENKQQNDKIYIEWSTLKEPCNFSIFKRVGPLVFIAGDKTLYSVDIRDRSIKEFHSVGGERPIVAMVSHQTDLYLLLNLDYRTEPRCCIRKLSTDNPAQWIDVFESKDGKHAWFEAEYGMSKHKIFNIDYTKMEDDGFLFKVKTRVIIGKKALVLDKYMFTVREYRLIFKDESVSFINERTYTK
ncbi:MAG: hypothetical protein FWD43_06275, partial [Coriobacteriia bacterium]|nr:hypothetical protein [Coriobacteriia bacterium]